MYTNINQENVHLPSFGGRESDNMGLVPYIYFDPEYSVLDEIKSSILIAETTMHSHPSFFCTTPILFRTLTTLLKCSFGTRVNIFVARAFCFRVPKCYLPFGTGAMKPEQTV